MSVMALEAIKFSITLHLLGEISDSYGSQYEDGCLLDF
jgi:hypothetical protein